MTHKCCITNCFKNPRRCYNYEFYCREHFNSFILSHSKIAKQFIEIKKYKLFGVRSKQKKRAKQIIKVNNKC